MVAAGLQYTGNGNTGNTVGTIQQIQYAEHRICNGGHNVLGRVNVSNSTLMLVPPYNGDFHTRGRRREPAQYKYKYFWNTNTLRRSLLWRPVVADFNLGLNSQLNKTLNLKSFYWHLATIKRIRSPKQQNIVQISKYHATEAASHAFFEERIDTSPTSIIKKPSPLHHHRGITITIIFDLKC